MSTPIPVFICGKGDVYIDAVVERLKPDYEVIKAYQSVAEASHFLSNVLHNSAVDGVAYRKPFVAVMGGGFDNADYEELSSCSAGLQKQLVWLRPKEFQPGAAKRQAAAGPPTPEYVATRVRAGFDMYTEDISSGSGAELLRVGIVHKKLDKDRSVRSQEYLL